MVQQKTLGHYSILEKLGAGGMGEVFRAHDTRLRRDVAVKVMRPEGPMGEASVRRILGEARAIASLQHPNICAVHAVSETDGVALIDMELVEGHSLNVGLPSKGLPASRTLDIARQLAAALDHAHSRNVIHRDLKSANVMLTPSGQVKVLDFGLALQAPQESPDGSTALLDSFAVEGRIVGTLPYMAPEVVSGHVADARSDLWSLGVLLYEISVGRHPFSGDTVFELAGQIQSAPVPVLPRRVPPGLRRVIRRCLEKDPADRYSSAGELLRDLEATRLPGIPKWAIGGVVTVTLVAALIQLVPRLDIGCAPEHSIDPNSVTVFPFRVSGTPELAYLGEGMVDLLYPLLDGAGDLRATSPARVLREIDDGEIPDPERARELAAGFGSGSFILGTIVRIGDQYRLTGELYDAPDVAEPARTASITADRQEDLAAGVDDLARELLRDRLPESAYERSIDTNVRSLRAFLRGAREFRQGRYREAETAYLEAVEGDSSLAQAWLDLAVTYGMNLAEESKTLDALRMAMRYEDRLSPNLQKQLQAEYYASTEISDRSLPLARDVVSEDPANVRAWFLLADIPFHMGPLRGGRIKSSLRPLLQAREMGYPDNVAFLWHLRVAYFDDGDVDGYAGALERVLADYPESEFRAWAAAELAFLRGDEEAKRTALQGLSQGNDVFTFLTAQSMLGFGLPYEGPKRIAPLLVDDSRPDPVRMRGYLLLADLAATEGRWQDCLEALEDVGDISPDYALAYEAYFTLAPWRTTSPEELESLAARLEAWEPPPPEETDPDSIWDPHNGLHADLRLYLLGLARADLGQEDEALEFADRLAPVPHPDSVATLPEVLAQSIRAEVARLAGRPGEALDRLRWRAMKNYWLLPYMTPFASLSRERYVVGSLLVETGQEQEALDWLYGSSRYASADVAHRPAALRLRGGILAGLNRIEEAKDAYRSYLSFRTDADPAYAEETEQVRERLAAL